MTIRKWYMQQALGSFAQLARVLPALTEEEVLAALDLESQTNRRKSTIERLIARAVRMNEVAYAARLDKQYRRCYQTTPS